MKGKYIVKILNNGEVHIYKWFPYQYDEDNHYCKKCDKKGTIKCLNAENYCNNFCKFTGEDCVECKFGMASGEDDFKLIRVFRDEHSLKAISDILEGGLFDESN